MKFFQYPDGVPSRFSAVFLALALAGCAVGPEYQRPAHPLPAQYGESAAGEAAQEISAQWWKLFADAELDALVEKALRANNDLAAAVARLEEAEGALRETGAALLPEIDLDAGASRSKASTVTATPMPAGTPTHRDSRKAGLTTSFELDIWGKLRRATQAARAQVLASRNARDTVRLTLAGGVATAYLALRSADAQLAILADTRQSRETSLKIQRARLAGGVASALDLRQAESALGAVDAQLAEVRRQRALLENQLGLLSGEPGLKVAGGGLEKLPLPPLPPAGLPSRLLEARPDIRQAEEELSAASARIGVAKAALFPTLSLTGALGSESKALGDLFSGPAGTWSLGLNLAMPIFDAGRNTARIEQAEARQKQALANYQKAIQSAFKEVRDALANQRENAAVAAAQSQRLDEARQVLHLTELRLAAGYAAQAELLDARRAANDVALGHLAARQAQLGAAVDLFKALGGGWREEGRSAAP